MTTVRELRKQLKSLDQDATIQSWSDGKQSHTTSPDTSFADLQQFASNLNYGLRDRAESQDTHDAVAMADTPSPEVLAIFLMKWFTDETDPDFWTEVAQLMGPDNIYDLQKRAAFMAYKV